MIENLPESQLYSFIPEGVLELDQRGLVKAVVCGMQDRLDDLRSHSRKLSLLFQSDNDFPETGDNVVLVDIQSEEGKVFTRSLDLLDTTPDEGSSALTEWVLEQLGDSVSEEQISNIRYGRDLLRTVDAETLGYLAETIGAVLHQSSALSTDEDAKAARQRLVQTYFPRLKFKGTARSFEALGRILGFDDVRVTPLWSRVSPRNPSDVGSPDNDPDFSAVPEFAPRQEIGDLYNPLETNDGPAYTWSGIVSVGTAATDFVTQAVTGFNPWLKAEVLSTYAGTASLPEGSYTLSGGAPHSKAAVSAGGVRFEAICDGEYFNGVEVHVADSGSRKSISIVGQLSAVKYRSSYFDLAVTSEFDRAEDIYGTSAVRRNKDLASNPALTSDGTAASPYRPWAHGSISTATVYRDFLVESGTVDPSVVSARVQSSGTDRQLNTDELIAAGVQVIQAFEEVRPATRRPRRAGVGFLIRDDVGYAAYTKETTLFTTTASTTYSGSNSAHPVDPFYALIALQSGTNGREMAAAAVDPNHSNGFLYKAANFSGSYDFDTGNYTFNFTSVSSGTNVIALWKVPDSETVRVEPDYGTNKAYQARPEDEEDLLYDAETADEFPWLRGLTVGGELVDRSIHNPVTADLTLEPVENVMAIPGHDGADYAAYAIKSTDGVSPARLKIGLRPQVYDENGQLIHGMPAVAYSGALKNVAAISTASGLTDMEKYFESGAKQYMVGNVQGVLVADPVRFFSTAHRIGLVGWFPLNEHPDDAIHLVDRSNVADSLKLAGTTPGTRVWDADRGWYLRASAASDYACSANRDVTDTFSLSFWIKPGTAEETTGTLFSFGPLRIDYSADTHELSFYYSGDHVTSVFPYAGFNFICFTLTSDRATIGLGSASASTAQWIASGDFDPFEDTALKVYGRGAGLSDVRIWNTEKTLAELELVRSYGPVETNAAYPIGTVKDVGTGDRYALRVLSCGLCVPAPLPVGITEPLLAYATRYDSLGRYGSESRRKEVGLGGGPVLPASIKLGSQGYNLTADADTVVSTATGALPGENTLWLNSNVPPNYLRVIHTGSNTYDAWVSSGTVSPWANPQVQSNSAVDRVWVKGDDGLVYEVTLKSSAAGSVYLSAELTGLERTDEELELTSFGTDQWDTLRYSEQPTGAERILAGSGKILTVATGGTAVYQKAFSGTYATPPTYLYLNTKTIADVANAWEAWTENSSTGAYGNAQDPEVAALDENGVLEFTNSGSIAPGNYRLTIVSGNIGRVDSDFTGFDVEVAVDATILEKRLCEELTGYNFTGTNVFEFEIDNAVSGEWLLRVEWFNALSDSARGTARRLVIYSYRLERMTTELYKLSVGGVGSDPTLAQVSVDTFNGSIPGGWIASVNSYGSAASYRHESTIYPSVDTLTLKAPLSDILTGTTEVRVEDIIVSTGVQTDAAPVTMPSFGSVVDAGLYSYDPLWLWSGGVSGTGAVLAAKVAVNSPAVRFAVSTYGSIGSDAVYSSVLEATNGNSNTVKATVDGLEPNTQYYYAVEMGGSLAGGFIGKFKTYDSSTRNFSFCLASCSNNTVSAGVNPTLFDNVIARNPLFFLHMGDMHYNDGGNEPTTAAAYHNCWDKVFSLSSRQRRMWQNMPVHYIWDDHDFGPNDANGSWQYKDVARQAFQETVPHYPLAGGSGNVAPYHTFSVGRCFFIVLDTRSEADTQAKADTADKTRLGATQKAWFKQQLLYGSAHFAATFVVTPTTWGGLAVAGDDTWAGYSTERKEICDFVVNNNLKSIFLLSGDMHACALDDGTDNAFSTGGKGGMVILQAGPLSQSASQKGTPYTYGPYPPSGSATKNQYGMVTVVDNGEGTPYITFQAFDATSGTDSQLFTASFYGTQSPKP